MFALFQFVKTIIDTAIGYISYFIAVLNSFIFRTRTYSSSSPHLILVTQKFPPAISGGVYRPVSFVQAAVREGWTVTVVCEGSEGSADAAGDFLAKQIPAGTEIVRVGKSSLRPSYNWFPRVDGDFTNALSFASKTPRSTSSKTVVLASGPPFFSFIAGKLVAARDQASLVLDYRDEWTLSPFDFVTIGKDDVKWEHKCLAAANSVLITTESFRSVLTNKFSSIDPQKVHLVPNGYDPERFPFRSPSENTQEDTLQITYLGYLGGHTDIFRLIADIERIIAQSPEFRGSFAFSFYGKCDPVIQRGIEQSSASSMFSFYKQVTKSESLKKMLESDALLLLNPTEMHRYLPGKLFEYVASGSPILVYGEGGEIEDVVKHTQSGICVSSGDYQQLKYALLELLRKPSGSDNNNRRNQWLAQHDRAKIGAELMSHLETLL